MQALNPERRRRPGALELPQLPYPPDALEPYLSRGTVEYHWGEHHRGYVARLNELVHDTPFARMSLTSIVKASKGALFAAATQAWNHTFYWSSLTPPLSAARRPSGQVATAIDVRFGSFVQFKDRFTRVALAKPGSAWIWLSKDQGGHLVIDATDRADAPLTRGHRPLLVCDLWEHAYYLDYRNDRARYLQAFWNLVDWTFVEINYLDED